MKTTKAEDGRVCIWLLQNLPANSGVEVNKAPNETSQAERKMELWLALMAQLPR